MKLLVNGVVHVVAADPETPLLWVLREQLGLTGTKYSCGIGECGACTVHVSGQAEQSCTITIEEVIGKEITTIEGLKGRASNNLRRAWIEEDVPQCGYCQPGQIMTAAALLAENPHPDEAQINEAMEGVLCRCGTYLEIRSAIRKAADGKGRED